MKRRQYIKRDHIDILEAALIEARVCGWSNLKLKDVAERGGFTHTYIYTAYDSIEALRNAVMEEAVEREDLVLVAEGLALRHAACLAASPELKARAATSLSA